MQHQLSAKEWGDDEATKREASILRCKTPDLEDRLQEYKSILSPTRSMPVEVLSGMVIYAIEEAYPSRRTETLEWVCLVCRRRRDAAISIPKLWSEMSTSISIEGFSSDVLSSWLGWARKIPKRLSLFCIPACSRCRLGASELCHYSNPEVAKLLITGPRLDALTFKCTAMECFANFATSLQGSGNPRLTYELEFAEISDHLGGALETMDQHTFLIFLIHTLIGHVPSSYCQITRSP